MFTLTDPSPERIARFLATQRDAEFTYSEAGATAAKPPAGYDVDRRRTLLGRGDDCFRRACAALRAWRQFDLGWVRATPAETPLAVGATIAVVARVFGVYAANAARIVYVT